MRVFFFLLFFLFAVPGAWCQFPILLDGRIGVEFPSVTKIMKAPVGQIHYGILDKENKLTGMACMLDGEGLGLDADLIRANYNNSLFIELILQNLIGQYEGMTLESKQKITLGPYMGYEIIVRNDTPGKDIPYEDIQVRLFFTDARICAFSVLSAPGVSDWTAREVFFRSLKIRE